MSIKTQFAIGSFWVVVGTGLNNLAGFVVFAVLARLLDPAEIGLVALAMVVIEVSRVVVFGGIPEALVQRPHWDDDVASSCFWANLAVAAMGAAVIALAGGPLLSLAYGGQAGLVLAALGAVLLVDAAAAVPEAKLRREFGYRKLAARGVVATALSGVVGVWLAVNGFGIWALVGQRWVSAVLSCVLTLRAGQWRPRFRFSFGHLRSISGFIAGLMPARLLTVATMRVPDLAIGLALGPDALGIYRVGGRALEAVSQLTVQPVQRAALSAFSRLGEPEAIGRGVVRVTRVSAALACPTFLGAAATAPDAVVLLFGPQWAESATVMSVLALGIGATTLAAQVQPALTAAGRTDLVLRSSLGSFGATIAACAVSVWAGPVGVAAGQSARAYLSMPFWLTLLRQAVSIRPGEVARGLLVPAGCSVAMALAVLALRIFALSHLDAWLRLPICAAFGVVVYAALLATIGRAYGRGVLHEMKPVFAKGLRRGNTSTIPG